MFDASGGQFNGQRQSIQMGTDGGHGRRIGVGYREIRLRGLRSLYEEGHRLVVGEGLEVRQLFEGGYRERGYGELVLGSHMEPHAAGHRYFQLGASSQEFGQHNGSITDL